MNDIEVNEKRVENIPLNDLFLEEYLDYRVFLDASIRRLKLEFSTMTWREIATLTQVDVALLHKICKGERHLSPRAFPLVLSFLKDLEFTGFQTPQKEELFTLMWKMGRAKSDVDKKDIQRKIWAMKSNEVYQISMGESSFFNSWLNPTIFSLFQTRFFRGSVKEVAEQVGQNLKIEASSKEIEKSLSELLKLGILKQEKSRWSVESKNISTGKGWGDSNVRAYQKECLDLAGIALSSFGKEDRKIQTLTLHLDENAATEIEIELQNFLKRVKVISEKSAKSEKVVQLNTQYFPLSKEVKNG